jgi:hypothetical protein
MLRRINILVIIMEEQQQFTDKQKALNIIQNLDDSATISEIHLKIAEIDKTVWKNPMSQWFFISIGILAVSTFLFFFISICTENFCIAKYSHCYNIIKLVDIFVYSCWAIGVPAFFFFEYIKIFPYKLDSNQLADLKYTQELASKIWAALLLIFAFFLLIKYNVKP